MVQLLLGSTTVMMLSSILTYSGACLPNSMYCDAHAQAAVSYQAFHYSIIYLSRWRSEEVLWQNRLEAFRYSIACLSRWPSREVPGRIVCRLSATMPLVYRVGFGERRRGEDV